MDCVGAGAARRALKPFPYSLMNAAQAGNTLIVAHLRCGSERWSVVIVRSLRRVEKMFIEPKLPREASIRAGTLYALVQALSTRFNLC